MIYLKYAPSIVFAGGFIGVIVDISVALLDMKPTGKEKDS